jgi:hypothetical protein
MFCKTTALTLAISAWKKTVINAKLVHKEKTRFYLYYIKLVMMNHFVELQLKFPKINVCKIKDGIVVDPQI